MKNPRTLSEAERFETFSRVLLDAGYVLAPLNEQVHVGGERALTDRGKFVLKGDSILDRKKVIIKASDSPAGAQQIEEERNARKGLLIINSQRGGEQFSFTKELRFFRRGHLTFSVINYLERSTRFVDCEPDTRFRISLDSLRSQEAITVQDKAMYERAANYFRTSLPRLYRENFRKFLRHALITNPANRDLSESWESAIEFFDGRVQRLVEDPIVLLHSDFVPQNFRIIGTKLHFLDLGSFHFANRNESWARFLNWLMIYDPSTERLLLRYFDENRGSTARASLDAMRAYKIAFLIQLYSEMLPNISRNSSLLALQTGRAYFWTMVLRFVVRGETLPIEAVEQHLRFQDRLRTDHERRRQLEL